MRRILGTITIAASLLLMGGCMEELKQESARLSSSIDTATTMISDFREELEAQGDSQSLALADHVKEIEGLVGEAQPVLDQINTTIASSENAGELAFGIGEILAGLFGFGGVAAAVRGTVERRKVRDALLSGTTSADPATLAALPRDMAAAMLKN